MQNLVSLLPYLLCPLGMGLAMWFIMRNSINENQTMNMQREQRDIKMNEAQKSMVVGSPPSNRVEAAGRVGSTRAINIAGLCLNPRVLGGLAIVGLGVWVLAPGLVWTALPLLLIAACPLSMLFMMRGMRSNQGHQGHRIEGGASQSVQMSEPADSALASESQLANLNAQLASIEAQREAIASEIAQLEVAQSVATSETEPAVTIPLATAANAANAMANTPEKEPVRV